MSYKRKIAGGILHQTYLPEARAAARVFCPTDKRHALFGSYEIIASAGALEV